MAVGRIINKKICLNKIVNEKLSSDTCRLAFTWVIPHLDRDGRIHGEPAVLRSTVFPRRKDITDETMENFIREWAENRLVIWYEADGDKWLQFPKFKGNQPNLRYEREPESIIPPPEKGVNLLKKEPDTAGNTPANSRQVTGSVPADCPQNLNEFNISEFNKKEENLSENIKNPEQAPFSKNPPTDNNSPPEVNGTKSKDQQLAELAAHLKLEDPREYEKLVKQYPELKNMTSAEAPRWPP